jgi:hypothetical protein
MQPAAPMPAAAPMGQMGGGGGAGYVGGAGGAPAAAGEFEDYSNEPPLLEGTILYTKLESLGGRPRTAH